MNGHNSLKLKTSVTVSLRWLTAGAALAVLLWTPQVCDAGINFLFGGMQIPPPPSVQEEALTSDDGTVYAFDERRNVQLPVDLALDWDASVASNYQIIDGAGFFPGVIPAGTRVDSIFIHHDTPGQLLQQGLIQVYTDARILGLILTTENLDASDSILGAPGTAYPPAGTQFRGTASEATETDEVLVDPNVQFAFSVTIRTTVEDVFDQMRIITEATVPEPGALFLAFAATAFLALGRRTRLPSF